VTRTRYERKRTLDPYRVIGVSRSRILSGCALLWIGIPRTAQALSFYAGKQHTSRWRKGTPGMALTHISIEP
jgi:hypothetical protein